MTNTEKTCKRHLAFHSDSPFGHSQMKTLATRVEAIGLPRTTSRPILDQAGIGVGTDGEEPSAAGEVGENRRGCGRSLAADQRRRTPLGTGTVWTWTLDQVILSFGSLVSRVHRAVMLDWS